MMVVDASAILAIVLQEDDVAIFEGALSRARGGLMTPVNYWECLVRAAKYGPSGALVVEELLSRMNVRIVAVDAELARVAAEAFARFKGRGGGRLNLGDCFAYALAMREGDGLLFKGDDFPRTDVKSAL